MFQFHIPFVKLWIWEHAVFTLLRKLKCPLKLSSEFLEKIKYESFLVRKFWSAWYKSAHGRPDSPKLLTLHRVEPHCQLPLLLVDWFYRERNTHAMQYKCGGVRRLRHGKSNLQIIALAGGIDFT